MNVVVESAGAVTIFFQKAEGIAVAEIFELHQHAGEIFSDRDHEFLDERVVSFAANPFLPQAGVKRIRQKRFVVGADVNHHRQALRGMNSGARGVEREFADGNAHARSAEIAEAENALAVGDHNDFHVTRRPVVQDFFHLPAIIAGNVKSARPAENMAELLTRPADRRRVNNRHQLFQIVHDHAIKQHFIPVLERDNLDVALQVAGFAAEVFHHAPCLLLHGLDMRRQQSAQTESVAFRLGERRAFVENRIMQPINALMGSERLGRLDFCFFAVVIIFSKNSVKNRLQSFKQLMNNKAVGCWLDVIWHNQCVFCSQKNAVFASRLASARQAVA